MNEYNPIVVCFSCKFGWGYLADQAELRSSVDNWVPVICSGTVDPLHVVNAFRAGVDGVLILGCESSHCHFQDGNYQTSKKMYLMQRVLEAYGIEPERLRMEFSKNPEGTRIAHLASAMKRDIAKLGPVRGI
jgi:F420-non-reducing hydrogenase iron-sulfur subunit